MKPTRLQRAWLAWLALPAVMRIAAYIVILCVVLAVWPGNAQAGESMVATNGRNSVRLLDVPCSSEAVLQRVSPRVREQMREARATVGGEDYRACWIVYGDSARLMYEDGDQGLIPLTDFKHDGA